MLPIPLSLTHSEFVKNRSYFYFFDVPIFEKNNVIFHNISEIMKKAVFHSKQNTVSMRN